MNQQLDVFYKVTFKNGKVAGVRKNEFQYCNVDMVIQAEQVDYPEFVTLTSVKELNEAS